MDAIAAIQRAAGDLRENDGEATAEQVEAFVEVLMTELAMHKIDPPAQADLPAADLPSHSRHPVIYYPMTIS